jgi:hypothetical protein
LLDFPDVKERIPLGNDESASVGPATWEKTQDAITLFDLFSGAIAGSHCIQMKIPQNSLDTLEGPETRLPDYVGKIPKSPLPNL